MAWVESRGKRHRGGYRDAQGRKHYAGWSTSKRTAKVLAQEEEAKIRKGTWVDPDAGKITFSEFFEEIWLPGRVAERNTLSNYASHYRASLRPEFGDLALKDVSAARVQRWVNGLMAAGMKPRTIQDKVMVLQLVLAARRGVSAIRLGLIAENPCALLTLPTVPKRVVKVYSVEDVDALLAEIPAWWHPLVTLAAESGRRWGEYGGLKVDDFDDLFRSFRLQRTLVELPKAETGTGTRFSIKAQTKSGDTPLIGISPEASKVIGRMVRERNLFPMDRLFSMPGPDGLPLRTTEWPNGLPVSRHYFREAIWKPAQKRAGVQPLRFHDLRGSHISWLLAGGADITAVMQRAGHSQLATTQLYVSALADADQRALSALEVTRNRARNLPLRQD